MKVCQSASFRPNVRIALPGRRLMVELRLLRLRSHRQRQHRFAIILGGGDVETSRVPERRRKVELSWRLLRLVRLPVGLDVTIRQQQPVRQVEQLPRFRRRLVLESGVVNFAKLQLSECGICLTCLWSLNYDPNSINAKSAARTFLEIIDERNSGRYG